MAIPTTVSILKGVWQGISKLNYSEDPTVENVSESDSSLRVDADAHQSFANITYTWEFEGEGSLLLSGMSSRDEVTGGWVDSWHQSSSLMALKGTGMQSDRVRLVGSYGAPGQPNWGWVVEIGVLHDELEFKMINVSPDGVETWAVHALYHRA